VTSLQSLAAQTLAQHQCEIIAVGSFDAAFDRPVEDVRRAYPSLAVRVVRLGASGVTSPWEAGMVAASRDYLTLVEAGDSVSPTYLAELLAQCTPRVVAVAHVIDMSSEGLESVNQLSERLAPYAGASAPPSMVAEATAFDWGKAVPTDLARRVVSACPPGGDASLVFWPALVARGALFVPCAHDRAKAVYYRRVRPSQPPAADGSFDASVRERIEVATRLQALLDDVDSPDEGPDGTEWLVRDRLRAEAATVNEYVLEHPTDHGQLVELLDRHRIAGLPTDVMNRGLARGLAIAYAFPPYADSSAVVAAKRIRAEAGVVDVVYNAMDSIRERDYSIRRISAPFVSREVSVATPTYFQAWSSMSAFAIQGMEQIRRLETGREPYESLYSRAHFAASHFLATAYKLANPETPWTAEFSDPLSRDVAGQERGSKIKADPFLNDLRAGMRRLGYPPPHSHNCLVWCEELAYRLADRLVFTNESQLEYMLGYCGDRDLAALARTKAVVRPHPTLPTEFYAMAEYAYPLEPDLVHLAYFGTFYASRGLDEVLGAIARARPGVRGRLRLHVFTTRADHLRLRVSELGIGNEVRLRPYVRYLQFLNLTTRFDCLIVNDAGRQPGRDLNPFLPSKWSDYRGSGTPVWGLVDALSPLSRQVLDFRSPVGDVQAAGDVLQLLTARDRPQRT
jgi:hypothetical protein